MVKTFFVSAICLTRLLDVYYDYSFLNYHQKRLSNQQFTLKTYGYLNCPLKY